MYWNKVAPSTKPLWLCFAFRIASVQQGRRPRTYITDAMPKLMPSNGCLCNAVSQSMMGNVASTPSSGQTMQHALRQVPLVWMGRDGPSVQPHVNQTLTETSHTSAVASSSFTLHRPVKEALCHRAPFKHQPAIVTGSKERASFQARDSSADLKATAPPPRWRNSPRNAGEGWRGLD